MMHFDRKYLIQEQVPGTKAWDVLGEFDNIEAARKMVRELRRQSGEEIDGEHQ